MFLGYVGAIVGGISLAALLLVVSKTFRLKLPGWMYPAAAGLGMISLTIYTEYSWFDRTREQLPQDVEVVEAFEHSAVYRPWTYLVPMIDRFMAVDHTSARLNEAVDNVVLIDVYLLERFTPVLIATQFIHCETGERMLLGEDSVLDDNGLPLDEAWRPLGLDDPIVTSVCTRAGLMAS